MTYTVYEVRSATILTAAFVATIGHYVDILKDEPERIWVGVHFGSRGLGHKIATRFLNRAGAKDDMDSAPVAPDSRTQEGQDYIAAMKLAGRYAYAGRDWVCDRVVKILGAKALDSVHNHHNFAWQETHGGRSLWVVRKGATPAFPGQRGFVGGTMGENSVILEGIENDDAALSLYSTVHGAGRVMGRMEAKGKQDKATGEWKRPPKVTQEMIDTWVSEAKVEPRLNCAAVALTSRRTVTSDCRESWPITPRRCEFFTRSSRSELRWLASTSSIRTKTEGQVSGPRSQALVCAAFRQVVRQIWRRT